MSKKELIIEKAIELLKVNSAGLKYSTLLKEIQVLLPDEKKTTIDRTIIKLDRICPSKIAKIAKGFFKFIEIVIKEEKKTIEQMFKEQTGLNFNNVYKKYRPKLIWYLSKLSNDPVESEEIADEGFVKALDEISKYDKTKSQFSTWLFTIAKRLMIQRIKTKNRFESIEKDHDGSNIGDFLIADNRNMRVVHEMWDKKSNVVKCIIPELPAKYRTVLTMRELDGLSYQEISDNLNLNLSTVKSQIRQGRLLLRKKVKKDFDRLETVAFWDNY